MHAPDPRAGHAEAEDDDAGDSTGVHTADEVCVCVWRVCAWRVSACVYVCVRSVCVCVAFVRVLAAGSELLRPKQPPTHPPTHTRTHTYACVRRIRTPRRTPGSRESS